MRRDGYDVAVDEGMIRLRPGTAADHEFRRRLHREAMRPHVESTWGSFDDEAQGRRFEESTDPTTHEIIEYAGVAVGCQWVRVHADSLELVRLYLLPEVQGQGIGTQLVERLCGEADRVGLPVRLSVMWVYRAQRLYGRLGFVVVGETGTHFMMERGATSFALLPTIRPTAASCGRAVNGLR